MYRIRAIELPEKKLEPSAFKNHQEKLEEIMRDGLQDGDLVKRVGILCSLPKDRSGVAGVKFAKLVCMFSSVQLFSTTMLFLHFDVYPQHLSAMKEFIP
jgi:hypothetical protein